MDQAREDAVGFPDWPVKRIRPGQPLRWLAAGLADLRRCPRPSLFYGVVFAVAGFLILQVAGQRPYLVSASISGFFLIAPFLALGLYQISRRLEAGQPATLGDSITAWRGNYQSIGFFAAFLAFAFLFWERVSAIVFALYYGRYLGSIEDVSPWIFLSGESAVFLIIYLLVGAVCAAVVFALSVVAVPMLLDRRVDPVTAAVTSVRVTLANPRAMALWAALIVVITLLGIGTLFVGLVIAAPVLGHATWHAYRDLVGDLPADDDST